MVLWGASQSVGVDIFCFDLRYLGKLSMLLYIISQSRFYICTRNVADLILHRIATDLGLNRASSTKPLSERHERELLNRVRTWLNCFNVDRSSSTQWGKPTSLWEDETIRTAKAWYRRSRFVGS